MGKKDYTGAAAKFVEALKVNPNLTPAWEDLGIVYMIGAQLDNAEYCVKKARVLGGNVTGLEQQIKKVRASQGPKPPTPQNAPPEALEPNNPFGIPVPKSPPGQKEFQAACKIHESAASAFEARDFPKAMKLYKEALAVFPGHRGAWEDLALSYFETRNVRLLKAVIERLKKLKFETKQLEERVTVLEKSGAVETPEPGTLPGVPK